MRAGCPISTLHSCIAHASFEAFPLYEYEDRDWEAYSKGNKDKKIKKTRKHTDYDLTVHSMFTQTWGSTALGFGGVGGAAMTTAYTVIIRSELNGMYAVYFGGQFAYVIEQPNDKFRDDVIRHVMSDVRSAKNKYEKM